MKTAIMQPYFLPYIGYFQLIGAVDRFILYDNIKYTKKGWINRNRMLRNGEPVVFSLPLQHGPDHLDIRERVLAADFDGRKLLQQIEGAYRRAPYYAQIMPVTERILLDRERNLFRFLHHALVETCRYLAIDTRIVISSEMAIDHGLKSQDKVLALCEAVATTTYINAIGGTELYSAQAFRERGIILKFLRSGRFEYRQFDHPFVPSLSILDVMMFNAPDVIRQCIQGNYELV